MMIGIKHINSVNNTMISLRIFYTLSHRSLNDRHSCVKYLRYRTTSVYKSVREKATFCIQSRKITGERICVTRWGPLFFSSIPLFLGREPLCLFAPFANLSDSRLPSPFLSDSALLHCPLSLPFSRSSYAVQRGRYVFEWMNVGIRERRHVRGPDQTPLYARTHRISGVPKIPNNDLFYRYIFFCANYSLTTIFNVEYFCTWPKKTKFYNIIYLRIWLSSVPSEICRWSLLEMSCFQWFITWTLQAFPRKKQIRRIKRYPLILKHSIHALLCSIHKGVREKDQMVRKKIVGSCINGVSH